MLEVHFNASIDDLSAARCVSGLAPANGPLSAAPLFENRGFQSSPGAAAVPESGVAVLLGPSELVEAHTRARGLRLSRQHASGFSTVRRPAATHAAPLHCTLGTASPLATESLCPAPPADPSGSPRETRSTASIFALPYASAFALAAS